MGRMEAYQNAQRTDILLDLKYRAGNLTVLNRAYARMLAEQGIINKEEYNTISDGLVKIDGIVTEETVNSDKGDVFYLYEQALYDEIGEETACKLHTGRSRNDIYFALWRMSLREAVQKVIEEILDFQRLLEIKISENMETIIPYYTYGQPAQPGTWGHYLMTVHGFLECDVKRLRAAYENVNQSPMGAAAGIGSAFPLDKYRMSELLGFDAVIENSMAANSAVDYYLEALSAMAIVNTTIGRVSNDLMFFADMNCNILACDMTLCGGSSIMPQKKNLEAAGSLRARYNSFAGYLMTCFTAAGSVSLFPVQETYLYFQHLWENVDQLISDLRILGLVIERSEINRERAFSCTRDGFTASTAMAEALADETGQPFVKVHHVVGGMIRTLMDEKRLKVENMTSELMKRESERVLGYELIKDDREIAQMLDPLKSLNEKKTGGTPKPEDVEELLIKGKKVRIENEKWLLEAKKRIEAAYAQLDKRME